MVLINRDFIFEIISCSTISLILVAKDNIMTQCDLPLDKYSMLNHHLPLSLWYDIGGPNNGFKPYPKFP